MPIATARPIGVVRHRPEPFWGSRVAFPAEAALFILGAAGVYSVNIVGSLPGNELLLFPLLPVLLLAGGKRAFDRQYLFFYILALGWLLGTQIADAYNEIALVNRLKGTARVVFFILDFVALAILINNKTRRLVIFALSIATVLIIDSWQFREEFSTQWKFGLSQGLAVIVLLGSSYFYGRRRYSVCFLISLVLAGLNLEHGFRSQLGVHFVAAALILPLFGQERMRRGTKGSRQSTSRTLLLLLLAGLAAYGANASIKYAAQLGFFDESQRAKFIDRRKGTTVSWLADGPKHWSPFRPSVIARSLVMVRFRSA